MKRIALILVAVLAVLLVSTPHTYAHVLEADNQIGGLFHIEPDDNPVAGIKAGYSLAFKDTTNRFNLKDCGCSLTISLNNQEQQRIPLAKTNGLINTGTLLFSQPGVYSIEASGSPVKGATFQTFHFTYTVRVESKTNANTVQPFPILLGVGIGLFVVLLLLATYKIEHEL